MFGFFIFLALNITSTFAQEGGVGDSGGHGGDTLVAEFRGTTTNLIKTLQTTHNSRCIAPEKLQLIEEGDQNHHPIYVYSSPIVLLKGHEQDARNNWIENKTKPIIEISRIKLLQLNDSFLYLILNLHEHYGLLDPKDPFYEDTNDTTHSRECIESLHEQGVKLDTLVSKERPFTSIEEKLLAGDGELALECKTSKSNFFIFTQKNKAGLSLFVDRANHKGQYFNIAAARFRGKSTEQVLLNFSLEYSIQTGIGTSHFNCNLDEGNSLMLQTEDHATWRMTLYKRRRHKKIEATCVPVAGKKI